MITEKENKFIFGFSLINKVGPASFKKIAGFFSSFQNAWEKSSLENFIKAGLKEELARMIITEKNKINLEKEWEKMNKKGIEMMVSSSNDYPEQLKNIPSPPFVIFYQGDKKLLKKKQLAVIGSRKPTIYGQQTIEKIIPQLVYSGLVITSGLALGIDSLAHKKTLENNGQTIAVLGSGLSGKNIPANAARLLKEILEKGGLIISEYPPDFSANKFTFPARNRIISGLSLGVLVVEATEKSGTLITADYALQQNREVFAVPGNIFSPFSVGTNQLIKNGAKLVSCVNDIFEELNFVSRKIPQKEEEKNFDNELENKIYNFLTFEPTHIDKIAKEFKLSPAEASQTFSLMEIKGFIKSVPGNKFVRN